MKKIIVPVLVVIFVILLGFASYNPPAPVYRSSDIAVALNSIYVYRGIKRVNIILTISGYISKSGHINLKRVYVKYQKNSIKCRLNVPPMSIPYEWTYSPKEYQIVLNGDVWDWSKQGNTPSYVIIELEHQGINIKIINQTGLW
jgi:hypothetical protein